jgi:PAS domain S-box-containing protein
MMTRPLVIIHDRLQKLNSETEDDNLEIEVINNDEYAAVYKEINQLIKRQQSELEISRDQLQRITEGAPDPIIVYDSNGLILRYNPAAEQYFGASTSTVHGKRIADVMRVDGNVDPFLAAVHEFDSLRRFKASDGHGRLLDFEAHVSRADYGDRVEHTVGCAT